ncbi:PqqD family peptide modification chaperone [Lactococcus petauri]|uniref:PqqD family peptide modification chaperone n=1 Tax=Lactococcus petauri TaxID=1940789 RepID=UPI003854C5EE
MFFFFKEQHKTEEELLEYLLEEYDVSKEEMIDDVKDMLEELLIQEILITG